MELPLQPAEDEAERLQRRIDELTHANQALQREVVAHARAEDELRASATDARLVIDGVPALLAVLSPTGAVHHVNKTALNFFALSLEEIRGSSMGDLVHPHDVARTTVAVAGLAPSGEPLEVELRLRRFDGVYPWCLARASPVKDGNGRMEYWHVLVTDIDRRKRDEDSLRARELSLRLFVDSMEGIPALAIISNEAGEIVFANQKVLDYYGRTLEDVKRWPTSVHIVHPDDLEHANQLVARALREGKPCQDEYRLQRHDGVYRWFEGRYSPVRDESGRITNWYVLLVDIDDRKRSDEKLRQSEAKLAAESRLLEMVARGVDLRECLEELCRQVEALAPGSCCSVLLVEPNGERFRLGAGPSLPDAYNSFLDGVPIDPDSGPCGLAVTQKAPVVAFDLADDQRWTLSGRMTAHGFASAWSTPVLSSAQAVLGTFAIYWREPREPTSAEQEIVARFTPIVGIAIERARSDETLKDREEELERAHAHLTEAQRLSKTGSFTWNTRLNEDLWSEELYRIFGIEPSTEISWTRIRQFIHPEDLPAVEAINQPGKVPNDHEYTHRIINGRGELRYVHTVAHRSASNRHIFYGAIQDVTDTVLAEQALNQAHAELTRMARVTALSALTASIAHEVSQPLAGIVTNASTCLRMLAAEPPNVEGALATAQRTLRDGNRATDVLQRLRSLFARRPPSMAPVDLNETALEVLSLLSGELQRRGVTLRSAFADSLPSVRGDRVQLQQVILNLVVNAADALIDINDRPRDVLLVSERDGRGRVRLRVRDAGVGLDAQSAQKLFEPFHTTKPDGMGIGLSVSRSIIEAHEGRLWADANEDGPGSTFSFWLPTRRAAVRAAPRSRSTSPRSRAAGAR